MILLLHNNIQADSPTVTNEGRYNEFYDHYSKLQAAR